MDHIAISTIFGEEEALEQDEGCQGVTIEKPSQPQ
jgi:hypothetical protein